MFGVSKSWTNFINGEGLDKLVKAVEQIKTELHNFFVKRRNKKRYLILCIRLEHLQIKKHQKIALKYLQKLEEEVLKDGVKEEQRKNFRKTYKVH